MLTLSRLVLYTYILVNRYGNYHPSCYKIIFQMKNVFINGDRNFASKLPPTEVKKAQSPFLWIMWM